MKIFKKLGAILVAFTVMTYFNVANAMVVVHAAAHVAPVAHAASAAHASATTAMARSSASGMHSNMVESTTSRYAGDGIQDTFSPSNPVMVANQATFSRSAVNYNDSSRNTSNQVIQQSRSQQVSPPNGYWLVGIPNYESNTSFLLIHFNSHSSCVDNAKYLSRFKVANSGGFRYVKVYCTVK